jgi:hypothetical protein
VVVADGFHMVSEFMVFIVVVFTDIALMLFPYTFLSLVSLSSYYCNYFVIDV